MCRKLIYLISCVVVFSLVGSVQADVYWTEDGPDNLWGTAANWDGGVLPASTDNLRFVTVPGPTVVGENAMGNRLYIGSKAVAEVTVDGGTLTAFNALQLGLDANGDGTLNMKSGAIIVQGGIIVGRHSKGTLNMTGGTITVSGRITIPERATGTGHIDLHGGVMTAASILMRRDDGGNSGIGTIDVKAGTLIIGGDALATIQGYIDNGWITAYGGQGTLNLEYNDVTNKTTLTASHILNPNPADDSTITFGDVELSWTLPDPCVAGQPVSVDVYFTDDWEALYSFTNPAAIQVVSNANVNSVVVQTQLKTRYYWAVDTYIGNPNDPILGPIFSFYADNLPPEVDAGSDVVTWLQDGLSTGDMEATVTDTGVHTMQWTVVSEPNDPNSPDAVITDPSAEDTSITLSALGEYVLKLEAADSEYSSSDTVTINVYNDSCEAAKALPGYEPFPGDLNGDCIVDDLDLAILEKDWLKDNSAVEVWIKVD